MLREQRAYTLCIAKVLGNNFPLTVFLGTIHGNHSVLQITFAEISQAFLVENMQAVEHWLDVFFQDAQATLGAGKFILQVNCFLPEIGFLLKFHFVALVRNCIKLLTQGFHVVLKFSFLFIKKRLLLLLNPDLLLHSFGFVFQDLISVGDRLQLGHSHVYQS